MSEEEERQIFAARFCVPDLGFERKRVNKKWKYCKIADVSEEVEEARAKFDLLFGLGFRCEYKDIEYIQKDKKEVTVFFRAEKKYFRETLKDSAYKNDRADLKWANEFADYALELSTKNISGRTMDAICGLSFLCIDAVGLKRNLSRTRKIELCDGKRSYNDEFSLHRVGFLSSNYNLYFTRKSSIEPILELEKKLNIFKPFFADFKIYPALF